jgi:hypothetical protein
MQEKDMYRDEFICQFVCPVACIFQLKCCKQVMRKLDMYKNIVPVDGIPNSYIVHRHISNPVECWVHLPVHIKQLERFSWKLETGKFYEKLWSHLEFQLGQGSSTYSLYINIFLRFCVYLAKYLFQRNMSWTNIIEKNEMCVFYVQ